MIDEYLLTNKIHFGVLKIYLIQIIQENVIDIIIPIIHDLIYLKVQNKNINHIYVYYSKCVSTTKR